MSAMQQFHTAIRHGLEVYNPNLAHLVQLTQISLPQVRTIESGLWWFDWPLTTE